MVPLDDDAVALIDRIAEAWSPGQPMTHPKTRRPAEFLLTHFGRRVSTAALRDELARACQAAGLPPATPHQLRHTAVICTAFSTRGTTISGACRIVPHKYSVLREARATRPVPGSFSLRCCF